MFDANSAVAYGSRDTFERTAILALVIGEETETPITTSFGHQVMRGAFYLVADGEGSYGAARAEFEHGHRRTGPTTWVKQAQVLAYRTPIPATIETRVNDHVESVVEATAGDWIIRQETGELMVLRPEAFDERYELIT